MAAEVGQRAADRGRRVEEPLGQPARDGAVVGDPHAPVGQRAERAGGQHVVHGERGAVVEPRERDDERDAGRVRRGDDLLRLGDRRGEHLLAEDVLAGGGGAHDDVAVRGRLGGDGDGVDVVAGEQRVEIVRVGHAERRSRPPRRAPRRRPTRRRPRRRGARARPRRSRARGRATSPTTATRIGPAATRRGTSCTSCPTRTSTGRCGRAARARRRGAARPRCRRRRAPRRDRRRRSAGPPRCRRSS